MLRKNKHSKSNLSEKQTFVENREYKRWYLLHPLKIMDKDSGEYIGNISNISIGGMNVVCKYPLEIDDQVHWQIDLSDEQLPFEAIDIVAKNIWYKEELVDHYAAGMKFESNTDVKIDQIETVIAKLGFIA